MMRYLIATLSLACCLLLSPTAVASVDNGIGFERHSIGQQYTSAEQRAKPQVVPGKRKAKASAKRKHASRTPARSEPSRRHRYEKTPDRRNTRIVEHPAGCPSRNFCGCGVSKYIFGKVVREGGLAIAAEWLRFPRAEPAPGMVAARRGHVFAILKVVRPGVVLAYDPNSGRHLTKIHERKLAGYTVVNPRASKEARAGA